MSKNQKIKIGIVGCGAIGSSLAKAVKSKFSKQAVLSCLYDIHNDKAEQLAARLHSPGLAILSLRRLIGRVDLVIEATHAGSAFVIARETLSRSKDIMILSVGGILKDYKKLMVLAGAKKARILIPSGAICGIDGLKAAACGKVSKVTLTTRKPPQAFLKVDYLVKKRVRLDNLKKDKIIFSGSALEAVENFPQNINVAATLSMAGIGAKRTQVHIVASPSIKQNMHEIEIYSDAGKIISRTENAVHADNPKTSYLAVLSAIATLKQALSQLKIGN